MTIEEVTVFGFVFAATILAAMAYERRMDVLYGPYVEGRDDRADHLVGQFLRSMHSAVDRLR
jgi:hypothetical protein